MPEGATGFYTNWWNGGRRGAPGWERFFIDELVPLVERRFRVRPGGAITRSPGSRWAASAPTFLGSQLPGYFGSASSFSGLLQHQRPQVEPALEAFGARYQDVFGPQGAFYATGHNSTRLAEQPARHPAVRDGRQREPRARGAVRPGHGDRRRRGGGRAARAGRGVRGRRAVRRRGHDLRPARRGARLALLAPPPARGDRVGTVQAGARGAARVVLRHVAQKGEMWGLRYAFRAPPSGLVEFERAGARLRGRGAGTVAVEYAAGCSVTAALPFDRALPPRICGRIAVKVSPRRVRLGRTRRMRFRVTRVAAGGASAAGCAHPHRGAHRAN